MKKILLLAIGILLYTSCNQDRSNKEAFGYDLEQDGPVMAKQLRLSGTENNTLPKTETPQDTLKKIIKDGRLGLKTTALEASKARIDSLLKPYGAYYANENFNNTDYEWSYNLKIRIPSVHFEHFINAVETGNNEVLYKEIDARDVTDQFIDLQTRLDNKRNYLTRYQDLLKKANSVKEILEIEEKIRVLEEEIESTVGRLKYLNNQVDYSTLDLQLSQPKDFKYNPSDRDKFSEKLKQSLSKGWYGFVDFILALFYVWPFWILLFLVFYAWRRYRRQKRKK